MRKLVDDGFRVAAADVATVHDSIAEYGDAVIGIDLDVTSAEQWQAAVATVADRFGGLSALVNNAGILHRAPIAEETPAGFESSWRVNCLGPFLGIRAALEQLAEPMAPRS